MNERKTDKKALVLTIGTGNMDDPEASLFTPLQKSIRNGEWDKVVLLPSHDTKKNAHELKSRFASAPLEISPLPKAGQEEDADACFAHFDEVLNTLRSEGFSTCGMVADFTRGTKAMSAALVLAAVRHEIPVLRYITGKRNNRGQVVAGEEVVREIQTQTATCRQKLDTALQFIRRGAFAAVLELLPPPDNDFLKISWPEKMVPSLCAIRSMAEFYSCWDKFDYASARKIAEKSQNGWNEVKKNFPAWKAFFPTKEMRKWVQDLTEKSQNNGSKARILRKKAADILANAERRVRDNQYEDAVIRAYRIRELIAQIRLFEKNIDSNDIGGSDPAVARVKKRLEGSGRSWHAGEGGHYQASREKAAMLLTELGDPIGKVLLNENRESLLSSKNRNMSLLIHGFNTMDNVGKEKLLNGFKEMESLILEDDSVSAKKNLRSARLLNFGVEAPDG